MLYENLSFMNTLTHSDFNKKEIYFVIIPRPWLQGNPIGFGAVEPDKEYKRGITWVADVITRTDLSAWSGFTIKQFGDDLGHYQFKTYDNCFDKLCDEFKHLLV
jgi:hypothetical protein